MGWVVGVRMRVRMQMEVEVFERICMRGSDIFMAYYQPGWVLRTKGFASLMVSYVNNATTCS